MYDVGLEVTATHMIRESRLPFQSAINQSVSPSVSQLVGQPLRRVLPAALFMSAFYFQAVLKSYQSCRHCASGFLQDNLD